MAKKKKYDWVIGGTPPPIDVHSIAKHRVLKRYLFRYIQILTANPRRNHLRLHLVDGFAGGGLYSHGAETLSGSPLILLDTVQEAAIDCNVGRRKELNLDTEFYFVDQDVGTIEYLHWAIEDRGWGRQLQDGHIRILRGQFGNRLGDIVADIRRRSPKARALFLLDQYGYQDVPFDQLNLIFSKLPNAEIILNIATDSLINFLEDSDKSRKAVAKVDEALANSIDWDSIDRLKAQGADWRLVIEKHLSDALILRSGTRYATRFFIRSEKSNRAYWLVHLCQHHRAHDEMLLLHYDMHNTFTRKGPAGFWTLGYDPRLDEELDLDMFLDFDFDSFASERAREALREQLPKVITNVDGVRFGDLRNYCFNRTPAHQGIIKEAIFDLVQESDVEILTPRGGDRRVAHAIQEDDIIRLQKQTVFVFDRSANKKS